MKDLGYNVDDFPKDWIFGYGSIINDDSRKSTLQHIIDKDIHSNETNSNICVLVRLKSSFGYQRAWNFRSQTGFTAVGLQQVQNENGNKQHFERSNNNQHYNTNTSSEKRCESICGVLFPAGSSLSRFDVRETGYKRLAVDPYYLEAYNQENMDNKSTGDSKVVNFLCEYFSEHSSINLVSYPHIRFWVYVPSKENMFPATEDFPICQTYVDTVLHGCLQWGGKKLASEWINTTVGWSIYFLNDAPLSRRPWLHRPSYKEIDKILLENNGKTHFRQRRHPEDFASHWHACLRGMWGVPPRNPHFIGREKKLHQIAQLLHDHDVGDRSRNGGITTIETLGIGGVGKTQVAIEYCYRHYQSSENPYGYAFIMWLRAESSEAIASDFRNLAQDSGIPVLGMKNEEVVAEIRSRLYRSQYRWLLVFDNVNCNEVLETYMPRGGSNYGSVLITSRVILSRFEREVHITLDCFNQKESLRFLRRAAGNHAFIGNSTNDGTNDINMAGEVLAERLGHLPLALAMAAAYMRQCDIGCKEYLQTLDFKTSKNDKRCKNREIRFFVHQPGKLANYPLGVADSLSLSLQRIALEGRTNDHENIPSPARRVLDTLCFVAPDDITKPLVKLLLRSIITNKRSIGNSAKSHSNQCFHSKLYSFYRKFGVTVAILATMTLQYIRKKVLRTACAIILAATAAVYAISMNNFQKVLQMTEHTSKNIPKICLEDIALLENEEFDESDILTNQVWISLKQFSLLTVRHRTGSIHRLLQQLLRSSQNDVEIITSFSHCVWALRQLWCFDPANTSTWNDTGKILEHVKTVGYHIEHFQVGKHMKSKKNKVNLMLKSQLERSMMVTRLSISGLLTDAALFMSMALSRFDEAQKVLNLAHRILKCSMSDNITKTSETPAYIRVLARTLHTCGKVARYRGNFHQAEKDLCKALDLRWSLCTQIKRGSLEIASSLHELGVVYIKKRMFERAEDYLQRSLLMKRELKQPQYKRTNETDDTSLRFSDEAATLHQLAVVATFSRPRRLDEAENLLHQALSCEMKGPFGPGGRAATLRQLACVSERRGNLESAEIHLLEALVLYRQAYGSNTPHLNIAVVRNHLGNIAQIRKQYEKAADHFLEALRVRQKIYCGGGTNSNDSDHIEIATTLGRLGQLECVRKQFYAAQEYFQQQREMIERILNRECNYSLSSTMVSNSTMSNQSKCSSISSVLSHIQSAHILQSTTLKLLNLLAGVCQWQKTVAKEFNNISNARILTEELRSIKKVIQCQFKTKKESKAKEESKIIIGLERCNVVQYILSCRQIVRAELVSPTKMQDVNKKKNINIDTIISAVKILQGKLSRYEKSSFRESAEKVDAVERIQKEGIVFAKRIEDSLKISDEIQQIKKIIFAACDDIRTTLRQEGVYVNDTTSSKAPLKT